MPALSLGLVLELREPYREVAQYFHVEVAPQHLAVAGSTAWLAAGSTLYRCGPTTTAHPQANGILALLATESDVWVGTLHGIAFESFLTS